MRKIYGGLTCLASSLHQKKADLTTAVVYKTQQDATSGQATLVGSQNPLGQANSGSGSGARPGATGTTGGTTGPQNQGGQTQGGAKS